ncbi:hypothetical protein ABT001_31850 [Streptomyces sp. NPDC002793]|uniref:RHS repeat domain-containing protein n=1 Tax=Streptomyces sp. NPDC002793 TaxID=3154432 RepID=UPI003327B9AA
MDAIGARTDYEFDAHGGLITVRDAAGGLTRITNDAAGLPVGMTTDSGASMLCTRDPFGRVTEVTDAMGATLRQGWTVESKLTWRELPDGTREQWAWDGEGNLIEHVDRMGRVNTSVPTHFDRVATRRDADGNGYRFTHDTELRLTTVTNAHGLEWHYTYDAAGRLVAETDFDGRTVSYTHDAVGRLIRRTNAAGQSLAYERDVLGRVTRIRHEDGAVSAFTYAATGHLVGLGQVDVGAGMSR